tara:strand:- start:14871 stop:15170 length:300 start_codon:yes stop_codon:yes gene_type:complete
MGFDVRSIDFDDISRSQKQGVVSDVKFDHNKVMNTDRPLEGVVKSQRARTSDVGDILNIGSGTRCKHCGFLHFMWRASCGACERPMEYNLGDRDEKNRM